MNATIESLKALRGYIIEEADERRFVREDVFADGLLKAVDLVDEEIRNQEVCERIDAMTPEELDNYLTAHGENPVGCAMRAAELKRRLSNTKPTDA